MKKLRIPIMTVAVFGAAGLVAFSVAIVLYIGLASAIKNTRQLMTDQAEAVINSLEHRIDIRLQPVHEQAQWVSDHVSRHVNAATSLADLDHFMLGALAATPQIAGFTIVTSDLISRRWTRASKSALTEDWSARPEIEEWLRSGPQRTQASWIEPFFTATIKTTVLLHDWPLFDKDGKFFGMLGQIVPITDLSREIAGADTRAGVTPFILYGRDRVLAHPSLVRDAAAVNRDDTPLPTLIELGDTVLNQIWTPDEEELYFIEGLENLQVAGAFIEKQQRYFVYLYRDVARYGPTPWTLGVYIDTDLYGGAESDRLRRALIGSLAVLIFACLAAIWLGHRVTRPVSAIANAAQLVEANRLSDVPVLTSSRVRELDDAARSFNKMVVDLRERMLIRETLGRFVPEAVARKLLTEGGTMQPVVADATLLYSDLESFTALTETLGPTRVVSVLNAYFSAMVEILERHDGVVTQFQGDAILATFNVPIANSNHVSNAIHAAAEMLTTVESTRFDGQRLGLRIGINTGSVVAGAVGASGRLSYTVHGDSVNLAARLEALNKELGTRILISGHCVNDALGIVLTPVGETAVRGQSNKVKLFTLISGEAANVATS